MFDALEAINDIIDDINTENGEACYEAICDELDTRVESGDLTLEDAQVIADRAAEMYLESRADADIWKEEIETLKKRGEFARAKELEKILRDNTYVPTVIRDHFNRQRKLVGIKPLKSA